MAAMFAELLATPGVEEVVELRSRFGFLAFHGGSLERMTDVIAMGAAEEAGASVYAVVQPPHLRWHIPSHVVGAAPSPALAGFLAHVEVAVALHGYGREGMWHQVLLGGSNRDLARHLASVLRPALPGFAVVDDLSRIPRALQGMHPDNPANKPSGGGVQVELPPRVRGLTPHGYSIEPVVQALAAAAASYSSPSPSNSKVPPARQ
jgi:phage replication-related protein YjqB (UPF0714/DUF867 family)